ncbi:MAG TPA: membrane protein insertase YidC [bacterium]|nr:membrane protein insertase YidC [bacterium]HOL46756.1 membrane protein insertase YidC [bacterium]HPQ18192.1 membrane protein insertase YidC [bacterium]
MNFRLLLAIALSFLFIYIYQIYFLPQPEIQKKSNITERKEEEKIISDTEKIRAITSAISDTLSNINPIIVDTEQVKEYKEEILENSKLIITFQNVEASIKSIKLKEFYLTDNKEKNIELNNYEEEKNIAPLKMLFEFNEEEIQKNNYYKIQKINNKTIIFERQEKIYNNYPIEIKKEYKINEENYIIDFQIKIKNLTEQEITLDGFKIAENTRDEIVGSFALLWFPGIKNDNPKDRIVPNVLYSSNKSISKLVEAGKISINKKFEFDEIKAGNPDWLCAGSTYFANILIPLEGTKIKGFEGIKSTQTAGFIAIIDELKFSPLEEKVLNFKIYSGPKKYDILKNILPELKLQNSIDFGWTKGIAVLLLQILNWFYKIIPDYGVAIILLTILVNIILYPLKHKSAVSMEATKKFQPQINALKEKYKNDKRKLNEELMALYREHKINPLGGCLPLLLQIPIFFGLYNMLAYAIELRNSKFNYTWIKDLSSADPYYILPILFGLTMVVQQKMSPMPNAEQQKIMMWFMPIFLTFLFLNFSSGLVLYFLVNNIIGIIQQYIIHKKIIKE